MSRSCRAISCRSVRRSRGSSTCSAPRPRRRTGNAGRREATGHAERAQDAARRSAEAGRRPEGQPHEPERAVREAASRPVEEPARVPFGRHFQRAVLAAAVPSFAGRHPAARGFRRRNARHAALIVVPGQRRSRWCCWLPPSRHGWAAAGSSSAGRVVLREPPAGHAFAPQRAGVVDRAVDAAGNRHRCPDLLPRRRAPLRPHARAERFRDQFAKLAATCALIAGARPCAALHEASVVAPARARRSRRARDEAVPRHPGRAAAGIRHARIDQPDRRHQPVGHAVRPRDRVAGCRGDGRCIVAALEPCAQRASAGEAPEQRSTLAGLIHAAVTLAIIATLIALLIGYITVARFITYGSCGSRSCWAPPTS